MRQISNQEHKKIMLDILLLVDQYCKENKIQYFLDSGTLIGAVRHKGYIPWDDDMDICMSRPDYDKFLEMTGKKPIASHIEICEPKDSLFPYIKICDNRTELVEYPNTLRLKMGVYIDVFPKEGHPDKLARAIRHCRHADLLTMLYWFNTYSIPVWKTGKNKARKLIAYIASPFYKSEWPLKRLNRLVRKYNYDKSKYTSTILAGGVRGRVPVECFASSVEAEFEGHKFPIPVGYDQYLRKLYKDINDGDYMTWPPEDQRIIHENEIYWKE